MGGKLSKKRTMASAYDKVTVATKKLYYKAEFMCLGDVLKDHRLNASEFSRLMVLLQLPDADKRIPALWDHHTKATSCNTMSLDEYTNLMLSDHDTDYQTSIWRKLFAKFDTDGNGSATRDEVIQGLEKMGIDVNKGMREKINAMDSNKDGRINYGDFLKMQLHQK